MTTPDDLRYTSDHEWVRALDGDLVRIGITDHAQCLLGDVVFVQLPEVGTVLTAGEAMGEVESTKSVSEIYAPLGGEVTAVNTALEAEPDLVNSGPYDDGWMVELRVVDDTAELLDAAGYRELAAG